MSIVPEVETTPSVRVEAQVLTPAVMVRLTELSPDSSVALGYKNETVNGE